MLKMVKGGSASGRKNFQHRVRPSLLFVGVLAGIVTCLMVVTHRRCAFDDSYTIRCGGEHVRRRQQQQHLQEEQQKRYTYSDVLWERVDRTRIEAQDWNELSAASSRFDFKDRRLQMVVKLVKHFFEPWRPIAGVKEGFGAERKAWKVASVREAAVTSNVMACCLHVRVVNGQVFFRYGQVISLAWRLSRANDFITFLQLTVEHYQLKDLRVEFLFNTCDHPLGTGASFSTTTEISNRANYLVLSNHMTEANTDVLVPDFLDWGESYMPTQEELLASKHNMTWEERESKLVFRGSTTNYLLEHFNWGSSARVRLHRMTDAFPHLLEARISRWSHTTPGIVWHMKKDKVDLASRLDFAQKDAYKYELVMDGGLGTTRLCGVMSTDRVVVRQSSPFFQFFDPLLKRGRHFVEVMHNLQDLAETVVYMQQHDEEMKQMVRNAHREMGWICSVQGRMLALAVMLVKYQALLEDSHLVEKPKQMCPWGAPTQLNVYTRDEQPNCMYRHPSPILQQPGCPTVCSYYGLRTKDWFWLSSKDLTGWRVWNTSESSNSPSS